MKKLVIAVVATLVIAGGGGFYGGMAYAKSKTPSGRGNFAFTVNGGQLNANRAANRQGAGLVNGEVLSKDDKSITVKDRNAGSKIIFFAPSTVIGKMAEGTSSDLAVGANVTAMGTANSDGTITAQSIQIRPEGAGYPGFAGGTQR